MTLAQLTDLISSIFTRSTKVKDALILPYTLHYSPGSRDFTTKTELNVQMSLVRNLIPSHPKNGLINFDCFSNFYKIAFFANPHLTLLSPPIDLSITIQPIKFKSLPTPWSGHLRYPKPLNP